MNKNIAVKLQNISKIYKLYDKPIDRLKESIHPFKKKYHKDFYALKDINLEIKKGEVLGIVGVNGAGKSTLLKIISGVLTPTSGRINIHGKVNAILELGSGLKPEMTGIQNIKLSLQINGIEKNRRDITREIIDFADIGEHIEQPIKTYSSGMKARLGFAIATSTDPDVLIIDEVLAVGDVLFQRKCYEKIEKLFKDGKTVIFVSHSAQSVIKFCSRAVLLYEREIVLNDSPKKVTDFYQKLVFSKDKVKVVSEINQADYNQIRNKRFQEESLDQKDLNEYISGLKIKPININEDFFQFKNVMITNLEGQKVNNLLRKKYILSFDAEAKRHGENIYFGAQFKSLKGIIISGCNLKELSKKTIKIIKKNEVIKIKIEFDNLLLTSTYIVSIFVTDDSNKNTSIQNNSYIFNVQKFNIQQAGFVTLNQSIRYKFQAR